MKMKPLFGASLLTTALFGCSSPNDDGGFSGTPAPTPSPTPTPTPTPTPLPTAEGLWTGNTNTSRSVTGLVLGDGTFYFLYSVQNTPNLIAGVIQGNSTATNGNFSSSDAKDFNFAGAGTSVVSVSGPFVARQTLNGTITYVAPTSSVNFNTVFNADYDTTPTPLNIAGVYAGQLANTSSVNNAAMTITTAGAISGTSSGCDFSGTVTPRATGNVYNASIAFGPPPCFFPNQTVNGIAYRSGPRDLYMTATNALRTDAMLFVGSKP